ncbi:hypothetical protein ARTHRO9AX_160068 [Arthrobacter sp. 9AX]|nr:hypothetical protein ARTHRO9AX_160068 [Arthrobacter sp. 9AX]
MATAIGLRADMAGFLVHVRAEAH